MQYALLTVIIVCVNALYALLALGAANTYGIPLSFRRGAAAAVLVGGTAVECITVACCGTGATLMLVAGFGAVIVGAASDAACGYVFDLVSFSGFAALSVVAAISHGFPAFVGGALLAGGCLALLYAMTRGRGLGLGDVKLACCIGGAAGAIAGIEALGVAFVLGGTYACYLLAAKRAQRKDEMRFAPYLAAGMAVAVLYGAFS